MPCSFRLAARPRHLLALATCNNIMSQVRASTSTSRVWGNAYLSRSLAIECSEGVATESDILLHKRYEDLPPAFKVLDHEDAQAVAPHESSMQEYDESVLKTVLQDAFTVDANVKADRVVKLLPQVAWGNMYKFKERGLVLYFTGRLPQIRDIAMDIDAGFGYYVVDKIFFAGNGLYEVLFHNTESRDLFLSTPTVLLKQQVVHVLPWQPVRIIKDELLTMCPVWVELVDLPSFLWGSIKDISASLGKVLFSPSINSVNRNKVCVLWKVEDKLPETLEINIGVGRIVIYLKWGSLSGACYHCGNIGHFTKHCPSLKESQEPLIPSYPGSKNLIPPEQVFGKNRPITPESDSSTSTGPGPAGPFRHPIVPPRSFAEALNRKKNSAPVFGSKTPVYPPPSKSVPAPQVKPAEKGKRQIDSEGFTTVQRRNNKSGRNQQFSSGYTFYNPFVAQQHAGSQARPSHQTPPSSPEINLEIHMEDGETIPNTQV